MNTTCMEYLNDPSQPVVLCILLVYTVLAEVVPRTVTRLNSNAYTSQIRHNITTNGLKFQLVNYLLYHQGIISQVVHGITIFMDAVLWSCYFHCLLLGTSPLWAYSFVFLCCVVQTLTYDDARLKLFLTLSYTGIVVLSSYAYDVLDEYVPEGQMLAYISIALLVNAVLRVFSHFFEPLPIDYLWFNNKKPIKDWFYSLEMWKSFAPLFMVGIGVGVFSELQAGTPIRLLSSFLVLFCTETVGVKVADTLEVPELRKRARSIDENGWRGDSEARAVFAVPPTPRSPIAGNPFDTPGTPQADDGSSTPLSPRFRLNPFMTFKPPVPLPSNPIADASDTISPTSPRSRANPFVVPKSPRADG